MSISSIGGNLPPLISSQVQSTSVSRPTETAGDVGFGDRIGNAVKDLAASQNQARESATAFELGLETDLASVMVDQQVASLGFQMALNVRNKALGAYRDIMNMPV